jgi:hypothetical protein
MSEMAYNRLMGNGFSRLEAGVERLVEGTFARLFAGRLHPREVALHLARAMEDNAAPAFNGLPRAPEHYVIHLNIHDVEALLAAEPALPDRLADELIGLARDAGLILANRPEVTVVADAAVAARGVVVEAGHDPAHGTGTLSSTPVRQQPVQPEPAPSAYLIVDGRRHVALQEWLVTLGRRRDNTVVVDDGRVSRLHAQIRRRYGRWVLFDLGSSGGTCVNDEPVSEWVLRPGDVISLAGVKLIYGEEELAAESESEGETGNTRPIHP